MGFVSLHVTSRRSGLDALERFSAGPGERLTSQVAKRYAHAQHLVLRTCNRFELYLAVPDEEGEAVAHWLAGRSRIKGARVLTGMASVVQLFSVASGLDSELIGEEEILGQVRAAYTEARQDGGAGPELGPLFERAIFAGRRVRRETGISKGVRSLSRLAIEEARKRVPNLTQAQIGILGTGEMGRKILTRLTAEGAPNVHVASRTDARRRQLAAEWPVPLLSPEQLLARLGTLDILFCAAETDRPYSVLSKERTRSRPLVVVDLGMPRNLEFRRGKANVDRIDLKDLQRLSRQISQQKRGMVPLASAIVREEAEQFLRVVETQEVANFADQVLSRAYALAREERQRALNRISTNQNPEEVLDHYGKAIVKRLLLPSLSRLKALPLEERRQVLQAVMVLFGPEASELVAGETVARASESGAPKDAPRRSLPSMSETPLVT